MKKETVKKYEYLVDEPLDDLIEEANALRKQHIGNDLQLCSIINARSGKCSEDCKFCAQSGHHSTRSEIYTLKNSDEIFRAAKEAKNIGSERFGIVTSGNRLTDTEIQILTDTIKKITSELDIEVCGSLGALNTDQLKKLKTAGMTKFHHNIETSGSFYPEIVSTHDFSQRINTIKAAKRAGLNVCSGGIIGLGESWQDRIEMALILKELDVDSVPINILIPIKGTPLENNPRLTAEEALRTICIFRIILPDKAIKIAAGRETTLKEKQIKGFKAGANGMIIGGYLTVSGAELNDDRKLIDQINDLWTE